MLGIEVTNDNGFIIAGSTTSYGMTITTGCILKTDSLGNVQWMKFFINQNGSLCRVIKQNNFGFIIGLSWGMNGYDNIKLIQTDNAGNIIWEKLYLSNFDESPQEVLTININEFIVLSVRTNNLADIIAYRINNTGDTLWTKSFGGNYMDIAFQIQDTDDNGFIICGTTESFSNGQKLQSYILKLDSLGNQTWYRIYSNSGPEESRAIRKIPNGFVISGYSDSLNDGCGKGLLRIIDNNGFLLKQISYSPSNYCAVFNSIERTYDGGFIISGWAENGSPRVYIVKTDSLLYSIPIGINVQSTNIPSGIELHQNYPNPFNPSTMIKYYIPKEGMISIKVYDLSGREILNTEIYRTQGEYEYLFDGSKLSSGVYFYQLEYHGNIYTKKMLLIK